MLPTHFLLHLHVHPVDGAIITKKSFWFTTGTCVCVSYFFFLSFSIPLFIFFFLLVIYFWTCCCCLKALHETKEKARRQQDGGVFMRRQRRRHMKSVGDWAGSFSNGRPTSRMRDRQTCHSILRKFNLHFFYFLNEWHIFNVNWKILQCAVF